ncbi:unnamed protein product [Mytilus coruscus]|uniref:Exonuclease domain-containing protein n=1 Tax=Mytilus coruscus TaxID=42192 RepID=A0A6J8A4J7_MYTCO|nr:unnamed protein product [Mytilus coruscus]
MGKLRLRNNGFRTSKQERKLVSIREGQRKRYCEEDHHQDLASKSVHADHSYAVTSKRFVPDISNIVHEEVLDNDGNNLTPTDDWRVGRRVVELDVIADHLQQCKHCGLPLSLHNTINIKTYGLGSVLKVLCTNKSCGNIKAIPTGKQHDHKIWDVNTKLALAAIDLGLGEHQINGLLSILNIPTVSHCMIDNRIREVGDVIESVADESMEEWTEKKKEMTRESDGNDNVTVSVDAAWQRRGSGRSYAPVEFAREQRYQVNVSSGLSPGLYTRKLATLRDIQARKRKAVAITTEAKLRRIALKASRNQSSSTFEVREGVCYQSNTMIDTVTEDSDEKILEIPAPKNKPVENDSKPDISTMTHIYFDIEATGLGRTSHITQISARRGLETFSKYILPACEITPTAAEVTGLTFQNGSLYLLDKIVPAVGVKEGLTDVQKVFQSELSVFYNYVSLKQMNKNVPSLKQMLDDKVVTKRTANCIARSGLNLSHLRLAYSRNGRTGSPVNYKGMCAFQCNKQDRAYIYGGRDGGDIVHFSSDDPTRAIVTTNNGKIKLINECFIKQGHFIVLKQEIQGNETHSLYACRKDANYDAKNDIRILHFSPLRVLPNYPTLCDVCIGIDFQSTRAFIGITVTLIEYQFVR